MARQYRTAKVVLVPVAKEDMGVALTHKQIAARLGISRARVGQLEQQALAKLRRVAEREGLTFADLLGGSGV